MKLPSRILSSAQTKLAERAKASVPGSTNETFDRAKELANDVKDVTKIAAGVASGNLVGAAVTAVKNKKIRRILIWVVIGGLVAQVIGFLLLIAVVMGLVNMFRFPLMIFSSNHSITETNSAGQSTTIHFDDLANAWEQTIEWGSGNKGLTTDEISQVNQLQLGLSYGLLEAFYELGTRQGNKDPQKTLTYVVQQLQPSAISFRPVHLRKVTYTSQHKKQVSSVTVEVLAGITRYNGDWTVSSHIVTEPDGSQIVVLDGATLQNEDYTPLYKAEKTFGFLHDTLDQQALFGQALVLDQNFYDPNALPMLQVLEGGGTGGPPGQGISLPSAQVIAILKQAIQIDGVPESWLPGLEIIVSHEDSSGDPYAVNPTPVYGEHASGLMQTLPSTFWEYHLAGYNDIWNPLDNAVAAIRYIEQGSWKNPYNIPGVVGGPYNGY